MAIFANQSRVYKVWIIPKDILAMFMTKLNYPIMGAGVSQISR